MSSPASRHLLVARRRRRWAIGLGVLGVLVVVLAAVTVAVNVGGSSKSTSSPTTSPEGSTTTTPSGTSVAAGGAPTISSLTPSTGSAGQVVVVSGTNLVSANGHVEVRFGDLVAPTSCPTQGSCRATVPPSAAGGRVLVTVSTQSGTSNGLWFTYR